MCGRYRLSRRKQIIEEHFDTADWQDDWNPRYNIAPTQPVPVIRQHPKEPIRQIATMWWGSITCRIASSRLTSFCFNASDRFFIIGFNHHTRAPFAPSSMADRVRESNWEQLKFSDGRAHAIGSPSG
jgi:putative SOS response-associated peptidase YedK